MKSIKRRHKKMIQLGESTYVHYRERSNIFLAFFFLHYFGNLRTPNFHYVLSMGVVFALFVGFYYWIRKIFGRTYLETLVQIYFWITFFVVNLNFFPMHFLGFLGMPRCVPNYPDAYAGWNTLSSFGYYISVVRICHFFMVLTITSSTGKNKRCVPSPQALEQNLITLKLMIKSPLAFHTFGDLLAIKETKSNVM